MRTRQSMIRVLLLLFFLSVPSLAQARLGETEAELITRFGQPKARMKDMMGAQGRMWEVGPKYYFQQGHWHIYCVLVDGRCAWIDYGKPGEWTEEQVQLVLGSNSQGVKWTETTKGGGRSSRDWKRIDGADAKWHQLTGMKLIVPAYNRAKQVIEAKAKAAASQKPKI
jgi:hypothetical protein